MSYNSIYQSINFSYAIFLIKSYMGQRAQRFFSDFVYLSQQFDLQLSEIPRVLIIFFFFFAEMRSFGMIGILIPYKYIHCF